MAGDRLRRADRDPKKDILMPAFKQVAPDVEVFHEVVSGGTGPYNEKLLTMWTGGSPPDV